jgi:chaperonin GroES
MDRRKIMELRPLNDRVVVKRVDNDTTTKGGIIIPDTAAEKPDQGIVLAVGKGKKDDNGSRIPLEIKVNDRVLFGKYSGSAIKHKGDDLLVLKEDDIFAVIEA